MALSSHRVILAIDPGRHKCGLALVSGPPLTVLARRIVPAELLIDKAGVLLAGHTDVEIVLGSGTGSAALREALPTAFASLPLHIVDEHRSSERARARYCRENPASGWRRLLPLGMRSPETPYDDYVAIELAEAFLISSFPSDPPAE